MAIDPMTAFAIAQAAPAALNLAKEFGGAAGVGIRNLLPKSWGKWRDTIGGGVSTVVGGPFGLSGYHEQRQQQNRQAAADTLVDNFIETRNSQFVNPALRQRAQGYAAGGGGSDPLLRSTAQSWLQGQGGIPYDTNLGNQLLRGDIPPSVAATLDRQLGTRFDRLRRAQGGQLARSGVLNSTIGGRLMADTYDSQRNALADAYMNTLLQRQGLGLNILGAADAQRRAYQSMGANQLGRLADRNLAYQQLGFNVLSDADRRRFARETFGMNTALTRLGQQQGRRDAGLESSANILGNLYTNYRDDQRFNQQLALQDKQFNQLLNLAGGGNISPIQAKANLSAVSLFGDDSVMKPGNRFKTLGEARTGAGSYGARNTPLTSRF